MPDPSLSESVHRLMHAYKYLLREGVRKQNVDLPVTQIRALKGICRMPECTAQSLALRLQRDKAQITRVLNDLIDAGAIVKADNPDDRRSQLLKPTARGKKLMARLDAAEEWAVAQLTRNLEPDDLAMFLRISNVMADSVRRASKPDEPHEQS